AVDALEPGLKAAGLFEDNRGLLQSQLAGIVFGADVLDEDATVGVANAGADVSHGIAEELRLHRATLDIHSDVDVLRLVGAVLDDGLETEAASQGEHRPGVLESRAARRFRRRQRLLKLPIQQDAVAGDGHLHALALRRPALRRGIRLSPDRRDAGPTSYCF